MSSPPTVSVVIPAFRAASTICRAVDSVLGQTHPPHEVIVVDDGSPDDVASVVEKTYGERVILIRKENGGAATARNAGIDRASGDFVAFLDADDYWEPHKLERQLAVFQRHPEVGLVAGRWFNQEPGHSRKAEGSENDPDFDRVLSARGAEAFRVGTRAWTGTVVIRKEAIGAERFSPELWTAQDRDFWVRIVASHPAYLISEPLATAVLEPGSLSRASVDRDCTNMLRVVARHRALLGPLATQVWKSHTFYLSAVGDSNPSSALPRLAHSLYLWPLPYWKVLQAPQFGRFKRMLVLIAKALHLRK